MQTVLECFCFIKYKGLKLRPFFLNPILPKLALCGAFRNYSTVKELLKIVLSFEILIYHFYWDPRVLDKFFDNNQVVETASYRHRNLAAISYDKYPQEMERRLCGKMCG